MFISNFVCHAEAVRPEMFPTGNNWLNVRSVDIKSEGTLLENSFSNKNKNKKSDLWHAVTIQTLIKYSNRYIHYIHFNPNILEFIRINTVVCLPGIV